MRKVSRAATKGEHCLQVSTPLRLAAWMRKELSQKSVKSGNGLLGHSQEEDKGQEAGSIGSSVGDVGQGSDNRE